MARKITVKLTPEQEAAAQHRIDKMTPDELEQMAAFEKAFLMDDSEDGTDFEDDEDLKTMRIPGMDSFPISFRVTTCRNIPFVSR